MKLLLCKINSIENYKNHMISNLKKLLKNLFQYFVAFKDLVTKKSPTSSIALCIIICKFKNLRPEFIHGVVQMFLNSS